MSSGPRAHTGYPTQSNSPPLSAVLHMSPVFTFENSNKQVYHQCIQCAVGDECHAHRVLRLINWLVCWSFGFRVELNCFSWCDGRSSRAGSVLFKSRCTSATGCTKGQKWKRRKDSVMVLLSFVFAQLCTFDFFWAAMNFMPVTSFVLFVCFVYTHRNLERKERRTFYCLM